jgi:hypothetical protein
MRGHGGEVLLPGRGPRHRRHSQRDATAPVTTEDIVEELKPLASQVPPPVLGAAVRGHMAEMARLLSWLRD